MQQFNSNILMSMEPTNEKTMATLGIDVAIPCYQYGRFLRDCVYSVLNQSAASLRILIIDNASTDNSLEVAQQLAAEHPTVQVEAHPRNLGPHASFNEAIDWAEQEYFLLLCADDLLTPGALKRAVAILDQHPEAGMAYGQSALLRPGEKLAVMQSDLEPVRWRILSGQALLNRFCGSAVCHIAGCTAVVRTKIQKEVGYYRQELPHTDDFEMWLRFAALGAAAETSAIQGAMRAHQASQSAYVREQHRWDIVNCEAALESFFRHEGGQLPAASELHDLARRSVGERAYWSAAAHLSRGDIRETIALFKLALRLRPTCAVLPPFSYLARRNDARVRLIRVLSDLMSKPLPSSVIADG